MPQLIQPDLRERLHSLDAVRGYVLLLGIALHATMSYLPGAQNFWFVGDNASPGLSNQILSGGFFWVHQFRMLTFFLIASTAQ